MNSSSSTPRYLASARSVTASVGEIVIKDASIRFDRSWGAAEPSALPGPGELLAAAFAACVIKNVERFGQVLPFAYDAAEIDVELHRQQRPSHFDEIHYVLRLVTEEPDVRIDLLARNLAKHGTVYNTLAAGADVSGCIERVDQIQPRDVAAQAPQF